MQFKRARIAKSTSSCVIPRNGKLEFAECTESLRYSENISRAFPLRFSPRFGDPEDIYRSREHVLLVRNFRYLLDRAFFLRWFLRIKVSKKMPRIIEELDTVRLRLELEFAREECLLADERALWIQVRFRSNTLPTFEFPSLFLTSHNGCVPYEVVANRQTSSHRITRRRETTAIRSV